MIEGVWLVHPEPEMCEAFRRRFDGLPGVRVIRGRFEDLEPHDCFVTARNAFGIMTAGIDAAVVRRFGEDLMPRVQDRIMNDDFGEQPVGTAFILPTGDAALPFLRHAPTMRVPGNIEGTDKVYTSTWAALLSVEAHNRLSTPSIGVVAFPAMGAGFGGVPFTESARQMAAAYRHYLNPPPASTGTSSSSGTKPSATTEANKRQGNRRPNRTAASTPKCMANPPNPTLGLFGEFKDADSMRWL